MTIQTNLTTLAEKGLSQVAREATPLVIKAGRALETVESKVLDTLGQDAAKLTQGLHPATGVQVQVRQAFEALLQKLGLTFDAATHDWMLVHRADDLLRILSGFRLDKDELLKLVKDIQHSGDLPRELARIKAIADYVRSRPWINPDFKTLEGFREALSAGIPSQEKLGQVLARVDTRFHRDYRLAPPWVDDAHTWRFQGQNGQPGDEGASYWLMRDDGTVFLAKIPPQTHRGVNERVGYTLYTALGVKANEVQFGQRDWLPLLTLHKRLSGEPVALNRVAADIGIDLADFRLGRWPYPADNIGTGPSTWNRPEAAAYQARITPRLADPAVFDKLHFLAHLTNDPDLKAANILATVIGHESAGKPIYDIVRIDFGIMMDGYQMRDLAQDLKLFEHYLETLDKPINTVYLTNILPTLKQFASMGDEQLMVGLMRGLHHRGDGTPVELLDAAREQQMRRRLLAKRDRVRRWLEGHAEPARTH